MTTFDFGLLRANTRWPPERVEYLPVTGSTNADLLARARHAPDRTVLLAGEQSAGRGRQARPWRSPAGAGLYLSVLLRLPVAPARLGLLPLLAGLAVQRCAAGVGVTAGLKWPNDLLAGPRWAKCAGILAEYAGAGPVVVLGIGLNVAHGEDDLPSAPGGIPATSLRLLGATETRREVVAGRLLDALGEQLERWLGGGDEDGTQRVLEAYRGHCLTLGRRVRIERGEAGAVRGTAVEVDELGRLVLETCSGARVFSAGDVVHLRAEHD